MNRKERRARGIDIGDTTVKYGARTLEIRVHVNTDETIEDVVARISPAAKGPGKRMVLITGGELDGDAAQAFWDRVIPYLKQQAAGGGEA